MVYISFESVVQSSIHLLRTSSTKLPRIHNLRRRPRQLNTTQHDASHSHQYLHEHHRDHGKGRLQLSLLLRIEDLHRRPSLLDTIPTSTRTSPPTPHSTKPRGRPTANIPSRNPRLHHGPWRVRQAPVEIRPTPADCSPADTTKLPRASLLLATPKGILHTIYTPIPPNHGASPATPAHKDPPQETRRTMAQPPPTPNFPCLSLPSIPVLYFLPHCSCIA